MTQTFKPYSEIPMILEQAAHKNAQIFKILNKYVMDLSSDFAGLSEKLSNLTKMPLVSQQQSDKKKGEAQEFQSELFKAFPSIAVNHLLQIPAFAQAASELQKFTKNSIDVSAHEYQQRNQELAQKFKDELAKYEKIRQANETTYNNYVKAGMELKAAEAKKAPEKQIQTLQKTFLEAKDKATAQHQKCVADTEACTSQMELLLTNFELLESWRADQLRKILLDFNNTLVSISSEFVMRSSEMSMAVEAIPFGKDASQLSDFSLFRKPESDEFFQVFRVHPLVSAYLPPETLFQDEVKKGGQLFVVNEDYEGEATHLVVTKGEIVVGMEQRGNCFYCKNINQCVGLLPKTLLAFYK